MSDEKRQELRVHGVSGTPPHVILYTEPTTDDLGPSHTKVYGTARDPRVEVRAFNWSSLTSGHWSTAFWVLLAPFAFANVAGWMLAKRTKTTIVATRLAALGLTGLFVAQLGVVFLELFGEWVAARGWPDAVALAGMWAEVALFVFLIYRFSVQSISRPSRVAGGFGFSSPGTTP